MLSVKELREMCEMIENRYGGECEVIMQFYDDEGKLKEASSVKDSFFKSSGYLYLLSKKVVEEDWL